MADKGHSRGTPVRSGVLLGAVLAACLCGAAGQVHGVPPFLPNIRPSVTSLGPYSAYNRSPFPQPYGVPRNLCPWGCRHRGGIGYNGYGVGYAPIYAVPMYDVGDTGPYLYSEPPAEQPLHVVVDLPPGMHVVEESYDEQPALFAPPPQHLSLIHI